MIIDKKPIRADDPEVLFCGKCGRPMEICRKNSIRCSAPPKEEKS